MRNMITSKSNKKVKMLVLIIIAALSITMILGLIMRTNFHVIIRHFKHTALNKMLVHQLAFIMMQVENYFER